MERVYTYLYMAYWNGQNSITVHTLSTVQHIHMFRLFRSNAERFFIIIHPILLSLSLLCSKNRHLQITIASHQCLPNVSFFALFLYLCVHLFLERHWTKKLAYHLFVRMCAQEPHREKNQKSKVIQFELFPHKNRWNRRTLIKVPTISKTKLFFAVVKSFRLFASASMVSLSFYFQDDFDNRNENVEQYRNYIVTRSDRMGKYVIIFTFATFQHKCTHHSFHSISRWYDMI